MATQAHLGKTLTLLDHSGAPITLKISDIDFAAIVKDALGVPVLAIYMKGRPPLYFPATADNIAILEAATGSEISGKSLLGGDQTVAAPADDADKSQLLGSDADPGTTANTPPAGDDSPTKKDDGPK